MRKREREKKKSLVLSGKFRDSGIVDVRCRALGGGEEILKRKKEEWTEGPGKQKRGRKEVNRLGEKGVFRAVPPLKMEGLYLGP